MDAETVATAISAWLISSEIEFRFRGQGKSLGPRGVLVWDSIVVEAMNPDTLEYHRLYTIKDATDFLYGLKKQV